MSDLRRWTHLAAVKLGLSTTKIFGYNPPYPNPHNFDTTEAGVPIVPDEAVISSDLTNSNPTVFGGRMLYSGSAESDTFQVRKHYGAPSLSEGDMFAYENQSPKRPALVYEVTEVTNRGHIVFVRDVGFLESSVASVKQQLETTESSTTQEQTA